VGETRFTHVGLYSDARFPGRLIVSLKPHYEEFSEVPEVIAAAFMLEVSRISKALKSLTSARRVNIAILGNAESHVHAHLIPRYEKDPLPLKSPWDDPRKREPLSSSNEKRFLRDLRKMLKQTQFEV